MPTSLDPQLAMDERVITNPDLEAALERHLRARDDAAEARGVVKTAKAEIDSQLAGVGDFPSDTALRIGRFRITKKHVEARHVEFDADARDQISIGLIDADGAPLRRSSSSKAKSVSDEDDADNWDDLRPKGEVNTDALRGEADRSIIDERDVPGVKSNVPTSIKSRRPRSTGGDARPN